MRPYLVIVRAGDSSLHPAWLSSISSHRNWDLLISRFGRIIGLYEQADIRVEHALGPKWRALHNLLTDDSSLLNQYDYIWFPDDDLACRGDDINLLFIMCKAYSLQLAQPSLSLDSYIIHPITAVHPPYRLRYTNFVELMAPVFATSFLRRCLPTFATSISGWGLDYVWPTLISEGTNLVAIIDAINITHTRPFGGPSYQVFRDRGINPADEMRKCLTSHHVKRPLLQTSGAVLRDGTLIDDADILEDLRGCAPW
jgi:hypothetical protein